MPRNPDRKGHAGAVNGDKIHPDTAWYQLKPTDAAGIRILIVEDDGMIAFHIADVLEKAGFAVLMPVATGEEALESLQKSPAPDLFFLDIQLAGRIDGIETARQIMERAGTPVIFMSAWSDNKRIASAALTKPYGYLVKPVSDRELLATVAFTLFRHSVDRKLAENEERYRAVFNNAAEGILILAYGTYEPIEANPAFLQLIGYGSGDRIPGIAGLLGCPEGMDRNHFRRILLDGGVVRDARLKCRDGSFRDVDITSGVIPRAREPALLALIIHDVSDRKRAETALASANRKLNLLSEVTRHDILNQLTILSGYLELSKDCLDDREKLAGFIGKEKQAADVIQALISFTRTYQNMGEYAPRWHNVQKTVRQVVSEMPPGIPAVTVDLPGIELYADPLFPKVIYNLIENAARHGGDNVSSLRFTAREGETRLILTIEDNGIGVPFEIKEQIFLRGFGKNTGLGLFLTREILSITGISIRETGYPGKGARFEITVPRAMFRNCGIPMASQQEGSANP